MHIILAPSAIKLSRLNAYHQIANIAGPFSLPLICLAELLGAHHDEDSVQFDLQILSYPIQASGPDTLNILV